MTDPFTHAASTGSRFGQLAEELEHAGFYPQVVLGVLATTLAEEDVLSFIVQPETTFADGVHRHLTLMCLTPTRLLIVHVDDHQTEDGAPMAMATSEAVPLHRIQAVGISYGWAMPAAGGVLTELTISISWGAVRRLELEPIQCPDPSCEADHGVAGVTMPDDISMRISAAVEGNEALARAKDFASQISRLTSVTSRA